MAGKKRKKELSMRKVREILRLTMICGMGQRDISRSCSVSPTTVGNYQTIAREKG